jgi:3D (Asp-Asp-Asp) domain-containing protein
MNLSGGINKGLMIILSTITLIMSPEEIDKAEFTQPLNINQEIKTPSQASFEPDYTDEIIQQKVLSYKAYMEAQKAKIEAQTKANTPVTPPKPKPQQQVHVQTRKVAENNSGWIPMEVQATAYNDRGTMAGGKYVYSGAIAVDPRLIPMGSEVKIAGFSGTFRAEDTGRLIKGHIIDIWMASHSRAIQWGRRTVKIWIKKR